MVIICDYQPSCVANLKIKKEWSVLLLMAIEILTWNEYGIIRPTVSFLGLVTALLQAPRNLRFATESVIKDLYFFLTSLLEYNCFTMVC